MSIGFPTNLFQACYMDLGLEAFIGDHRLTKCDEGATITKFIYT